MKWFESNPLKKRARQSISCISQTIHKHTYTQNVVKNNLIRYLDFNSSCDQALQRRGAAHKVLSTKERKTWTRRIREVMHVCMSYQTQKQGSHKGQLTSNTLVYKIAMVLKGITTMRGTLHKNNQQPGMNCLLDPNLARHNGTAIHTPTQSTCASYGGNTLMLRFEYSRTRTWSSSTFHHSTATTYKHSQEQKHSLH